MAVADQPSTVNIVNLVAARSDEIVSLLAAIDNDSLPAGEVTKGQRTLAQRLPRHMRRRAMSYNIKRMPRRIAVRAANLPETKHRKKPPSRHFRRRRLLLKRRPDWLETHIWHARRFHMQKLYGCILPVRPTQRSYRAVYRDLRSHAISIDLSYYVCLKITGTEKSLRDLLAPTIAHGYPSPFAQRFLTGGFEGVTYLCSAENKMFCPILFLWRESLQRDERSLLIWSHPASASWVENLFKDCVNVEKPRFQRHRLLGPRAADVLRSALCCVTQAQSETSKLKWWPEGAVENTTNVPLLSCNQIPGQVTYLAVRDPRLFFSYRRKVPPRRTVELNSPSQTDSPLWDSEICRSCASESWSHDRIKEYVSANEIFKSSTTKRENLPFSADENIVPIAVVYQSGQERTGFGSGFDIIIPANYGLAFWLAFQYNSARAAGVDGLDEARRLVGYFSFPRDFPVTPPGQSYDTVIRKEFDAKQAAKPPRKRVKIHHESDFARATCDGMHVAIASGMCNFTESSLLPVKLIADGKGIIRRDAVIYLEDPNLGASPAVPGVRSSLHADEKEKVQQSLSSSSSTSNVNNLLFDHTDSVRDRKTLRNRRKRMKKKLLRHDATMSQELANSSVTSSQSKDGLALLDRSRNSPVGFVTSGDYNLATGKSVALGLCKHSAIAGRKLELLASRSGLAVFIRNISNLTIRNAKAFLCFDALNCPL